MCLHVWKEKAMRSLFLSAVLGLGSLGPGAAPASAGSPPDAPATIHVTLPADATLTIDGRPTRSTSSERWFVTPPLEYGQRFAYTLQADFAREGRPVTVRQTVAVQAGRETSVSLGVPGGPVYSSSTDATETRAYYFSPASPEPSPAPVRSAPIYRWTESGPGENQSLRPGIHPIYWGRAPGDPFYYTRG
jgi:uncharacterized protein (TIGR03000 family)